MCLLNTVEEMVDVQENGNRQLGIHKENDMCVSELGQDQSSNANRYYIFATMCIVMQYCFCIILRIFAQNESDKL